MSPFSALWQAAVARIQGDQCYAKEHVFGIAVRVYEEIRKCTSAAGQG